MVEFKESKFYKLLQDFFINNNKETFLQMLAEFYNRTEGIIDKNKNQDELIKELRELYIEFNEKGIDENIVREKVNYFLENNVKIKDILAKLVINTNKIEDNTEKLNINTNNIEKITSELDNMKYYTTPEMFGAVGDGIADDSVILQKIIDTTGILIGNPNKTYKGNIRIKKSYTTIQNLNLKGSITFDSGLKFVKIEHCNINAEGNDYGIYTETNVTKLYINDCYIHNANICGLYLIDCWDAVLTKLSLSSNKKGFYGYQFNNGIFQGTAYGNEIGIEISGSYSCNVTGTIQENKLNGAIINSVHASEFRLYLEQNGYQGTDFKSQTQCIIGNNDARCIGTKFTLYGMGGSGSDMVSNYGVTIMSAVNCEINGYFTRHVESGVRITSNCINCVANVVDLNHNDYGYDNSLANRLLPLSSYIKSNTVFENSNRPIVYEILSKNSGVYKSSFEQISSTTAIIRVEDSNGERPTDINIRCYYVYNGIKTSI